MKKVLELEPMSVRYNWTLAMRFFQMHEYDRAIGQYQKTLELDPNDALTHELLGYAYEQKGMPKEAIERGAADYVGTIDEIRLVMEQSFALKKRFAA